MVKFNFETPKTTNFDAKVFLFDKNDNRIDSHIKKNLSSAEIETIEAIMKREGFPSEDKSVLEISLKDAKVFLFAYEEKELTDLFLQKIGGKLAKYLFDSKNVAYYIKKEAKEAYQIAFGYELGSYRFDKYFTKKEKSFYPSTETFTFISEKEKLSEKNYADFTALASSVNYVRDLVNEPANVLTPEAYANDVEKLKKFGLEIEILEEKELKKLGFNLLMAVAQASDNKPRVVVLKWIGNKKKKDFDLALVGKGVTFDTGGLSIKPSNSMETMNYDMGGSAVVVGTLRTLAMTKSKANVIGFLGLVENSISGNATRVNDIVTSMSGQTVEILNTDAEGRLVLADLLTYSQKKYGVKRIVDLATLTGAILVSLGKSYAGLFSNDDCFVKDLLDSSKNVDERLWHMPVDKYFDEMMDSKIADIKNIGGSRWGGSSQAACFLQRFIEKDVKWSHLDIAGTVDEDKGTALNPKGPTGFGVRLLVDYVKNNF
ncbi:MAG: leucyl aminopeptidase [Alphaproteobacteria bacterium]